MQPDPPKVYIGSPTMWDSWMEQRQAWRRRRDNYRRQIKQLEAVIRGQRRQLKDWQQKYAAATPAAALAMAEDRIAAQDKYIKALERDLEKARHIDDHSVHFARNETRILLMTHGYHDAAQMLERTWFKL